MELDDKTSIDFLQAGRKWLEVSGQSGRIRKCVVEYSQQTMKDARLEKAGPKPMFMWVLEIDLPKLLDIHYELAHLIIQNPMRARKIFQEVTYAVLVSQMLQGSQRKSTLDAGDHEVESRADISFSSELSFYGEDEGKDKMINMEEDKQTLTVPGLESSSDSMKVLDEDQLIPITEIHLQLKVSGMPWAPPWELVGVCDIPLNLNVPRLALVSGYVVGHSLPRKYTKCARYLCSNEECFGRRRDLHVRVFAAGKEEFATVQQQPVCRFCRCLLYEEPSSRELGEKATILVMPKSRGRLFANQAFRRQQAFNLLIRDELMSEVNLGEPLDVTIIVATPKGRALPSMEVINVHPVPPLRAPSCLSPALRCLLEDRQSSPWSFVLTLAYMFGSSVSIAGSFHKLKMALLLSLASCGTNLPSKAAVFSGTIPASSPKGLSVLAVGSNDLLISQLLHYAKKFAPRSVLHSSINSLLPWVWKDALLNETWVEAGSLLLSGGGVCTVGEISLLKRDSQRAVCEALESGQIRVHVPRHLQTSKGGIHLSKQYPLSSAVWAMYNTAYSRSTTSAVHTDALQQAPGVNLSKAISDVFDLVVYTETADSSQENAAEDVLILHTLCKATNNEEEPSLLQPEELCEYLKIVRSLDMAFSPDGERLLRGYFVTARRMRGNCVEGAVLPVMAIHALTLVAASHARLALRSTVEAWDAVAAIHLYEEAVAAYSGYSLLGVTPVPHLPHQADLQDLLGWRNDERMVAFQNRLENFILLNTGDIPGGL
ncbi:minichromosome maintenance domain-containing protein 2-like [Oratosquilla oratoria]|uniref:minichromosome maintenance domain-containing protein 2-like n=1 Tax=Oratosquilla oratoria TaxID=337810 RepID=UPI003F76F192